MNPPVVLCFLSMGVVMDLVTMMRYLIYFGDDDGNSEDHDG